MRVQIRQICRECPTREPPCKKAALEAAFLNQRKHLGMVAEEGFEPPTQGL